MFISFQPGPYVFKRTAALDKMLSVVTHVNRTAACIQEVLIKAEHIYLQSHEDFAYKNYGCMGEVIKIYKHLLLELDCKSRSELENKWKQHFSNIEVRDAVEQLFEVENKWNEFLHSVDQEVQHEGMIRSAVGDPAPCDIPLCDVKTGETVTLNKYLKMGNLVLILLRHFA